MAQREAVSLLKNLAGFPSLSGEECAVADFVEEYVVDDEHGEWHSGVTDDLESVGRKGAMYKGAYHNGRALLECIETLESL